MAYMLVRLQCRYGKVSEFNEVMSHLVPALEEAGWRLHGAYQVNIGRLNKVYDLWELPDANARSLTSVAFADPEVAKWAARLPEILDEEELEMMDELPYSVETRARRGG
jgi:hypothetical protein